MASITTKMKLVRKLAAAAVLLVGTSASSVAGLDEARVALEREDYETATRELLPLAHAGNQIAQYMMGLLYELGRGVQQDYAKSLRWYREAAEQGHRAAQYSLAVAYDEGRGAPQDSVEAAKWFQNLAEQGGAEAQLRLGGLYIEGKGVAQDDVLAHMWLNLAAAQGNKKAAEARELLAKVMSAADIAKAQKMTREWKPKK